MKKVFYLTLLCGLAARPGIAQLARNAGSQLPPGFEAAKQAEYNAMQHPDVSYQQFYDYQTAWYYHEDALRLNPSLAYRPLPGRGMCNNGDFEGGIDPNEWQGGYGLVNINGPQYGSFASGLLSGPINDFNAHHTEVGMGTDPNVPIATTAPTGSTHALRLGNAVNGNGAELISKTFEVTPDKSIVSFWYALVLENPADHPPEKQPAFRVNVLDEFGNPIPGLVNLGNGSDIAIADVNNPFFMSYPNSNPDNGPIAYRDWSCASINLSELIGKRVTVQFVTNDCTMSGHYGYAYLDDFCGSCSSNPYTLALESSSCGERSQVCIGFQLPTQGSAAATVDIDLNIYQNGTLLTTLNSGTLGGGSSYCFDFTPAAIMGFDPSLGGFDYTAVGHFSIGSVTLSPFYLFAPPDGAVAGQNNDCSFVQACCPGTNLISNGDFEAGNTAFLSDFTYQPTIGANSVWVGEYSVLTDAEALSVASTWNPQCPSTGRHLVVNAATGQASGYKRAWEQTISVTPGTYKFCGDFKSLLACAFNVSGPRINLTVSGGVHTSTTRYTITPTSGCNWDRIERMIAVTGPADVPTTLTLTITISELLTGDGNDLAMDNFSLVKLDSLPASQVDFSLNINNVLGWNYNVTATPAAPLAGGCTNYWEVAEVDPNAGYAVISGTAVVNPTVWASLFSNTFNGYVGTTGLSGTAPGVFDSRKTYRFVYGRSCSCSSLSRQYIIYGPSLSRAASGEGNNTPQVLQRGAFTDAGDQVITSPAAAMFRVFPNPASNRITVQKSATDVDYEVKVLNTLGQLLKTVNMHKSDLKVDFSVADLTPGNYIIHVVSAKGNIMHSEKITKL